MNWSDVERAFNRAVFLSFSRKKLALTFPVLVFCGILSVFCRALAYDASEWIAFSFAFLPIFLSSGILLALGSLLARIHYHEAKSLSLSFRRLIGGSLDLMIGTSYLSVPPILVYLLLWIVLGLFFLLKEIPGVGDFFSVVLSFGPFLLILGSLLLCLFNVGMLFFVAPAAALQSIKRGSLAKRVFDALKTRAFSAIALFFIAIIPTLFVAALLSAAAMLTNVSFSISERSLSVAMEWFFIMLPFAAVLSPAVVFFFNFAAESFALLQPQNSRI
jgi:hypothetical protein